MLFLDKPTKLKLVFILSMDDLVKVVMKQAVSVSNAFIGLGHGLRAGYRSLFVSRTLVPGRTYDTYKISYCSFICRNITRNYTSNHTHARARIMT